MKHIHTAPGIKNIEFINGSIMFVHLDSDRTFIVPLEKFPSIKNLSVEEKKSFEIIDDRYLSFLAIDDVVISVFARSAAHAARV